MGVDAAGGPSADVATEVQLRAGDQLAALTGELPALTDVPGAVRGERHRAEVAERQPLLRPGLPQRDAVGADRDVRAVAHDVEVLAALRVQLGVGVADRGVDEPRLVGGVHQAPLDPALAAGRRERRLVVDDVDRPGVAVVQDERDLRLLPQVQGRREERVGRGRGQQQVDRLAGVDVPGGLD